nr:hypothetical protein [Janthinobacterium sp. J1-1]
MPLVQAGQSRLVQADDIHPPVVISVRNNPLVRVEQIDPAARSWPQWIQVQGDGTPQQVLQFGGRHFKSTVDTYVIFVAALLFPVKPHLSFPGYSHPCQAELIEHGSQAEDGCRGMGHQVDQNAFLSGKNVIANDGCLAQRHQSHVQLTASL